MFIRSFWLEKVNERKKNQLIFIQYPDDGHPDQCLKCWQEINRNAINNMLNGIIHVAHWPNEIHVFNIVNDNFIHFIFYFFPFNLKLLIQTRCYITMNCINLFHDATTIVCRGMYADETLFRSVDYRTIQYAFYSFTPAQSISVFSGCRPKNFNQCAYLSGTNVATAEWIFGKMDKIELSLVGSDGFICSAKIKSFTGSETNPKKSVSAIPLKRIYFQMSRERFPYFSKEKRKDYCKRKKRIVKKPQQMDGLRKIIFRCKTFLNECNQVQYNDLLPSLLCVCFPNRLQALRMQLVW